MAGRELVLTGAGDKAFCTGGDQSAHEGQYDGRGVVGLPIDELQGLIRDVPKPVIARVNGFAIGGGNVLATLCDLTIAADTAQFGQVGPKVGSVDAGWGRPFWHAMSATRGPRNLVHQRPLHRRAGARDGPGQQGGSCRRARRCRQGWTDKLAQRSPTAIALAKRSFNADSDNIRGISNFALHAVKAVLRHGRVEGRRRGVQREARTELPPIRVLTIADRSRVGDAS